MGVREREVEMDMSEHDLGAVHCPLMFHGASDSRSRQPTLPMNSPRNGWALRLGIELIGR